MKHLAVAVQTRWLKDEPRQLVAKGGVPPYTFEVIHGLPSNLRLDSDGALHGVMSDANQTALVEILVTDSSPQPWREQAYLGIEGMWSDGTPCARIYVPAERPSATVHLKDLKDGEFVELDLNELFGKNKQEA